MRNVNMMRNQTGTGVVLLLISALVFSSAGLFTKGVSAAAWDVIFWRGLFSALLTTVFIALRGELKTEFSLMGKWGWAVAMIGASGSAAFITAFKFTSIANVSLIYAITPLLAAVLAWMWIGERITLAVAVGCLAAFAGITLIVGGSLGTLNLTGDLLAFWMSITLAVSFVIYRCHPTTAAAGPLVVSSIILLPIAWTLGEPDGVSMNELFILAGFGAVFAIAGVTMMEGARRLPSAETALLSTLEAPFAIVLAWIILNEQPTLNVIWGGAFILAGVFGSQLKQTKMGRNER